MFICKHTTKTLHLKKIMFSGIVYLDSRYFWTFHSFYNRGEDNVPSIGLGNINVNGIFTIFLYNKFAPLWLNQHLLGLHWWRVRQKEWMFFLFLLTEPSAMLTFPSPPLYLSHRWMITVIQWWILKFKSINSCILEKMIVKWNVDLSVHLCLCLSPCIFEFDHCSYTK